MHLIKSIEKKKPGPKSPRTPKTPKSGSKFNLESPSKKAPSTSESTTKAAEKSSCESESEDEKPEVPKTPTSQRRRKHSESTPGATPQSAGKKRKNTPGKKRLFSTSSTKAKKGEEKVMNGFKEEERNGHHSPEKTPPESDSESPKKLSESAKKSAKSSDSTKKNSQNNKNHEDQDDVTPLSSAPSSPGRGSKKSSPTPPRAPGVGRRTAVLFKKKNSNPKIQVKQKKDEDPVESDSNSESSNESNGSSSAAEDRSPTPPPSKKRRLSSVVADNNEGGNKRLKKRRRTSSSSEVKPKVGNNQLNGFVTKDDCAFDYPSSLKRRNTVDDINASSDGSEEKLRDTKRRSRSCTQIDVDIQPGMSDGSVDNLNDHLARQQYLSADDDQDEDGEQEGQQENKQDEEMKPLDLVWAKCRGYPPYPAMLIDPDMPRSGYCHNGVPIPVPPNDVLQVGDKRIENGNHNLFLVLFFDAKRTWQWLPRNKLELLGNDEKSDQSKLAEGRRPTLRKNVQAAYQRALFHKSKVIGDDIHDSGDDEMKKKLVKTTEDGMDTDDT